MSKLLSLWLVLGVVACASRPAALPPADGDGDGDSDGGDSGDSDPPLPNAGAIVTATAHPRASRGTVLVLAAETELMRLTLPDDGKPSPGEPFLATTALHPDVNELAPLWLSVGGEPVLLDGTASQLVTGRWPLDPLTPLRVTLATAPFDDTAVLASTSVWSHARAPIAAGIVDALSLYAQLAGASGDARLPVLLSEIEGALASAFSPSVSVGSGGVAALPCAGVIDAALPPIAVTGAGDALAVLAATSRAVWIDVDQQGPGPVEITVERSAAGETIHCSAIIDVTAYTITTSDSPTTSPTITVAPASPDASFVLRNAPGSCLQLGDDEGVRVEANGADPVTVTATVPPGSSEVCAAEVTVHPAPHESAWPRGPAPYSPAVTFNTVLSAPELCPGAPATTGLGFRDVALDGRPGPEVLVERKRDYAVYAIPTACVAEIDPASVRRTQGGVLVLEEVSGPIGRESPTYIEELVMATTANHCVVVSASILYSDRILVVGTGELRAAMEELSRLIGTFTAIASWAQELQAGLPPDFEPSAFKLVALLFELGLKGFDAVAGDPDFEAALASFERAMPGSTARLRELIAKEGDTKGMLEDGALALSAMGLFNHTFIECGSYVYCVGCTLAGESHHIVHRPEVDHYLRARWYHDVQRGEIVDEGAYYEGEIPP